MMKLLLHSWILLFFLFAPATIITAQQPTDRSEIDSLLRSATPEQADSFRYSTYKLLVAKLADVHPDSALLYAHRVVSIAMRMNERRRQLEASQILGKIHFQQGRIDSAQYIARQALGTGTACQDSLCFLEQLKVIKFLREPLRTQGDFKGILQALVDFRDIPGLNRGLHFETRRLMAYPLMETGDFDGALEELQLVRSYSLKVGDKRLLYNLNGELATAYFTLKRYDKALSVAKERVEICRSLGEECRSSHALQLLAHVYEEIGQIDSAYSCYKQLLQDEELSYFNYTYLLGNMLTITQSLQLPSAESYALSILEVLQNNKGTKTLTTHQKQFIYGTLSRYYLKEKRFVPARNFAQKRLKEVRQGQSDTTDIVADALMLLANTQAGSGDYETAWETFNEYHQFRMIVVNRNQEDALARTSVEMDLAENTLARQNAEQATLLEQQTSAFRTRFFLMLLGVAALILLILLWAVRRAQRDQQFIRKQSAVVEQSLAEKEILLREIHHRVKNNLQIISSLLDKQARKSSDTIVRKLVKEGQERIQSMALIHQNLYESDHLSGIDIKSYLKELSENIQRSQAVGINQIQLELNVAEEHLDIDTAIPVGLILNELLTNSYKYAFPAKRPGIISVAFEKTEGKYFLTVSDDGIGFQPEVAGKYKSLGLSLVKGLVRQLEGSIEWLNVERGTKVTIAF